VKKLFWLLLVLVIVVIVGFVICAHLRAKFPQPNTQKDEAMLAGRDGKSMPGADDDYYADMDYGFTKNPEQVRLAVDPYIHGISAADAVKAVAIGRNNWVVWTGGNDRLWDKLNASSVGNLDLLKTVSNYGPYQRDSRWHWYGLVNEPCYKKNTQPRADRWGLILDVRAESPDCKPDPFENAQKYPGVAYGARGKGKLELGSYYGYGTGIVGLRLFPNPDFDEKAQAAWDPVKYYNDPKYYNRADLVKPYRVGMSCGFCHVGPNPSNPPADPENPKWENLNSNPGAQYFWIERIFMFDQDQKSFVWQLFHTSRPGALDTSLVSSDEINNPRTMNAIYSLKARAEIATKWGAEKLAGGGLDNKQFNDYVPPLSQNTLLTQMWDPATKTALTTHVLKDGADSVGALGALNRVYLNIGLFSEDWLTHFIPLVGGPITNPIEIQYARKASSYWNANELQTPFTGLFFMVTAKPDLLSVAPGGATYMSDAALVPRGKEVFAERCARCHSSKLPAKAFTDYFKPGCIGPNYLKCWDDYWQWTKTDDFKNAMKVEINKPDFLVDNYLSTEIRVPVTLLETNACSPLATNAIRGDIWDNFSSDSYKNLPSVGSVTVHYPFAPYTASSYTMPAGGRGYTRPASLISLWSTAPFLQNNSVGHFEESGSVADRMKSFDDAIHQMLWPERRLSNPPGAMFATKSGKMAPGWIDTTTQTTRLNVASGYLPPKLVTIAGPFSGLLEWLFPNTFNKEGLSIGPIPKDTPVNLLANLNVGPGGFDSTLPVVKQMYKTLKTVPAGASDDQVREAFKPLVPDMLRVSKCTDFVVNRGHYFGTDFLPASEGEPGLTDADKNALIAFLKTF
jgi:hypothetical protein